MGLSTELREQVSMNLLLREPELQDMQLIYRGKIIANSSLRFKSLV